MNSEVIKYVAGGGKTTYSRGILKEHPRGLYLTYNNAVKDEILGEGHLAMTIDSFFTGFIIPKAISKIPLIPDGARISLNDGDGFQSGSRNIKINQDGTLYNQSKVISNINLNTPYDEFSVSRVFANKPFLQMIFNEKTLHISHEHRDQLVNYIVSKLSTYILDIMRDRFSYVIIDEAQDIKSSKEPFVELLRTSNIPTIILGDENQNINGGSEWFSGLESSDHKEESHRCGDGICKWIRDILKINITGTDANSSYIKIKYDELHDLDDGRRVLLYKIASGKEIKGAISSWSGPKRTIQNAKGATIKQDVVIIGASLSKKFLYTAITRTTESAYSTIAKINM